MRTILYQSGTVVSEIQYICTNNCTCLQITCAHIWPILCKCICKYLCGLELAHTVDQETLSAIAFTIMWVELGLLTISLLLALIYHKLDTMVKICPAHFHQQEKIIEVLEASKVLLELLRGRVRPRDREEW